MLINIKELCIAFMIVNCKIKIMFQYIFSVTYYMYSSTLYHEGFLFCIELGDNMVNQLTNIAANSETVSINIRLD